MAILRWINNHPLPVTCLSLAAVAFALYYLWAFVLPGWGDPRPLRAFYYDTVTGEFFPASFNETPPIATPSGSIVDGQPAGVRANVFSCGGCSNPQARYVAYIDTFTPEAHEAQKKLFAQTQLLMDSPIPLRAKEPDSDAPSNPSLMDAVLKGHMVATVGTHPTWQKASTRQGAIIIKNGMKKCPGGQYPEQCFTH